MAFHITNAMPTSDGGWVFSEETKVRLAGPDGPLARHILALPADSTGAWNLSSGEITAMLAVPPPPGYEQPLLLWDIPEMQTVARRGEFTSPA